MVLIRCVIGGNIGSGKSTLLNHLKDLFTEDHWCGVRVFVDLEPIEDMKPFLRGMYEGVTQEERSCNIFMLQIVIAMHFVQRMKEVDDYAMSNPDVTCFHFMERSILDAERIFVRQNIVRGGLSNRHADLYFATRRLICGDELILGRRDSQSTVLYIMLDSCVDVCSRRMRQRSRDEESAVDTDYLKDLHEAHHDLIRYLNEHTDLGVFTHTIDYTNMSVLDASKRVNDIIKDLI